MFWAPGVVATALLAVLTACGSGEHHVSGGCTVQQSTLTSVDLHTGQTAWSTALGQTSERPLLVEDGMVVVDAPCGAAVVGLADGEVRYDGTKPGNVVGVAGHQLFTQAALIGGSIPINGIALDADRPTFSYGSNTPFQAATVAGSSLVVRYGDQLGAIDASSSDSRWSIQLPPARNPVLLPAGHRLLVTSDDGSTYAVSLGGGALDWRSTPPKAAPFYGLTVTSVPRTVLTAATTTEAHPRRFVYATDAATGRLCWTRPAVGMLGADRELAIVRTTTAVEAVDTATGHLRWRRPVARVENGDDLATAALTPRVVVLSQHGDALLALDRATGRVRWQGPASSAAVAEGAVVLAETEEGVTAIDADTGTVLWTRAARRSALEVAVAPNGAVLLLDADRVPHLGA